MANLGEIAELINAQNLRLDVGSDTYITLQNLLMHIGRVENRSAVTDDGVIYFGGKGDNWFTVDMLGTPPEMDNFNTLTQTDDDNAWTETAWKIIGTARGGTTITFNATGVVREYEVVRGKKGGVTATIVVRITGDRITITLG